MAGYTPPPGVYFLDTFALYQAGGNLFPAIGSSSSTRGRLWPYAIPGDPMADALEPAKLVDIDLDWLA
jgi:hypothetical protein